MADIATIFFRSNSIRKIFFRLIKQKHHEYRSFIINEIFCMASYNWEKISEKNKLNIK
jgi:hypothetical protein